MTTAVMDPLGSSSMHENNNFGGHRSTTSTSSRSPRGAGGRQGLASGNFVAGEAIPTGSLHSLRSLASRRRTELDTDLHSTSSHSRRSTRSGAVRSVLSLHRTASKKSLLHHHPLKPPGAASGGVSGPPPPHGYATRGIVNYEDTDGESSSCDDDEDINDFDDDDDSNDSCSTFAESTNDCVANNRYLRRGMSIEIGASCDNADVSVSEFDDNIFNAEDDDDDDPHDALAALGGSAELDELRAYEEMLRLTGGGSIPLSKEKNDEAPPVDEEQQQPQPPQSSPQPAVSPVASASSSSPSPPLVSPERASPPPPEPSQPEEDMAYFV